MHLMLIPPFSLALRGGAGEGDAPPSFTAALLCGSITAAARRCGEGGGTSEGERGADVVPLAAPAWLDEEAEGDGAEGDGVTMASSTMNELLNTRLDTTAARADAAVVPAAGPG